MYLASFHKNPSNLSRGHANRFPVDLPEKDHHMESWLAFVKRTTETMLVLTFLIPRGHLIIGFLHVPDCGVHVGFYLFPLIGSRALYFPPVLFRGLLFLAQPQTYL